MKKALSFSLLVALFVLFTGCIVIDDTLDYRNDLSDYEVKKIVRKVLLSQNSINRAGLVTSDGLENIANQHSRAYGDTFSCTEGGYWTLTYADGTFALNIQTEVPLYLGYYECSYAPYYYEPSRLNGQVSFIIHQNIIDSYTRLLDLTLFYDNTYLYTSYGALYLDGEVGVHYDMDYSNHYLTLIVSASDLLIEDRTIYEKDHFKNIVLNFKMDTQGTYYTYEYSGTLYNNYLGRLTFTTLKKMEGRGTRNPFKGRFKIANEHMSITVVPLDDYYVDIFVQNHYYPTRDRTIRTTWINIGL